MAKVLLGMSGGVDSSTAAALLMRAGHEVIGATLVMHDLHEKDAAAAKTVAAALGIPHHTVDMREDFEKFVLSPFVSEYEKGRTPNPCIECNERIKFGAMLDYALENGCDGIATGHYAKIEEKDGRYLLKRSESAKDQSYFLCQLNQFQLSKAIFPLEGMDKEEIRLKAEKAGLPVARKGDSQEICFVPNDDYISYLASLGVTSPKGKFIDKDGNVLGEHNGIINYTIGQRKGLGAFGKPMFVTGMNAENNTVTIGENGSQYSRGLIADKMNFIAFEELNPNTLIISGFTFSPSTLIANLLLFLISSLV